MANHTGRFGWVSRLGYSLLIVNLGFLGLLLAMAVTLTTTNLLREWSWEVLLCGVLQVLGILLGAVWFVLLYGLIRVVVSNEVGVSRNTGRLARIETLVQTHAQSTRHLISMGSLSDQTKSLVFREREAEALRDAFNDALVREEYELAEAIIQNIDKTPGYGSEGARMRGELDESRKGSAQEKMDVAMEHINKIIEQKDWARATRTSQRLLQMFPDNPRVAMLPERIELAKTKHKRQLLQAYKEAVQKKDVDRSIDLLKELDQYLAPQEAAALEESARDVFRAKLQILGVQFALCVTDERWADAVSVGEQIIGEYPNSRMATEVSQKMEQLRARAAAPPQQD